MFCVRSFFDSLRHQHPYHVVVTKEGQQPDKGPYVRALDLQCLCVRVCVAACDVSPFFALSGIWCLLLLLFVRPLLDRISVLLHQYLSHAVIEVDHEKMEEDRQPNRGPHVRASDLQSVCMCE